MVSTALTWITVSLPTCSHFTGEIAAQGLFLGFAAWTEPEIDAGAEIIGRLIRKLPVPR